jgi:hypothetical protein
MTTVREASGPVQGSERMEVLDAVRGAALFGILLVNVLPFSGLAFLPPVPALAASHDITLFHILFLLEGSSTRSSRFCSASDSRCSSAAPLHVAPTQRASSSGG